MSKKKDKEHTRAQPIAACARSISLAFSPFHIIAFFVVPRCWAARAITQRRGEKSRPQCQTESNAARICRRAHDDGRRRVEDRGDDATFRNPKEIDRKCPLFLEKKQTRQAIVVSLVFAHDPPTAPKSRANELHFNEALPWPAGRGSGAFFCPSCGGWRHQRRPPAPSGDPSWRHRATPRQR